MPEPAHSHVATIAEIGATAAPSLAGVSGPPESLHSLREKAAYNWKPAAYLDVYDAFLGKLRDKPVSLLELGVAMGGSMEIWSGAFPRGQIVGVDLRPPMVPKPEGRGYMPYQFQGKNISFCQGSQDDPVFLGAVSQQHASQGWDIIIDDCSHIGKLTLSSFHILFPLLKPGGFYFLEDWGAGYWHNFPDGKIFDAASHLTMREDGVFPSHTTGMPGLIKQLVDEVAVADIYQKNNGIHDPATPHRSMFRSMHIFHGVVVLQKLGAGARPIAG
jgi:SAM-dependent methyltransferase